MENQPKSEARAMSEKERAHAINLVKVLAADLNPDAPNYLSTMEGIQQHAAALRGDLDSAGF